MRPLTRTLALAATGAIALSLTAGPAQAATTLDITSLPRGADSTAPHVEGKTLVDGTLRVPIQGAEVSLVGEAGTGYVVASLDRRGTGTLLRVESDGSIRSLGKGDPYSSVVSSDGTRVVAVRYKRSGKITLKVQDAVSGGVLGRRSVVDYPNVLDVSGSKVYLGGFYGDTKGTLVWDTTTDQVTKVSRRIGYRADAAHDLLATYTRDPYRGGCTVLSRLSNPLVKLWKSCDDTIGEFSTDGTHMATYFILTDGIGASGVSVRTVTGAVEGEYKTKRNGYVGTLQFEDPDTLLIDATVGRKSATVRCTGSACELASDVKRGQFYREAAKALIASGLPR